MYQMNDQTVDLLERVRGKLSSELLGEEDSLEEGEGGDVADAFDMYLDTVLERLVNETSMSEQAGASYIMKAAGELASQGDLPSFPSDDAEDGEVSVWLGEAQTVGFEHYVLRGAHGK